MVGHGGRVGPGTASPPAVPSTSATRIDKRAFSTTSQSLSLSSESTVLLLPPLPPLLPLLLLLLLLLLPLLLLPPPPPLLLLPLLPLLLLPLLPLLLLLLARSRSPTRFACRCAGNVLVGGSARSSK